jgi:hypothetical protein
MEKENVPNRKTLLGAKKITKDARLFRANWDSRGDTRDVVLVGESFCTDGDIQDVCSYGVDSRGNSTEVKFADKIYEHQDGRIRCQLNHSTSFRTVFVAVRSSSCGDSWSDPWKEVER